MLLQQVVRDAMWAQHVQMGVRNKERRKKKDMLQAFTETSKSTPRAQHVGSRCSKDMDQKPRNVTNVTKQ